MEEETKPTIYHKIEAGRKVRVFKSVFAEKTFYKTQIIQKNYDNTQDKYYIGLTFKKGVELDDPDGKGIDIIINCGYENFRKNPADKYNPILYIMVTDFTVCEREEQIQQEAFDEYREKLDENEMVTISDDFLD